MDEAVKKLWVDALRSGKYQQGKNYLRDDDQFCCLGVLCDLSGVGTWSVTPSSYCRTWYVCEGLDSRASVLPAAVVKWAGLGVESPRVRTLDGSVQLAGLNDRGRTFAEIADLIEASL